MEIPIIYKDQDLLVLNKPAGIAVHGGVGVKGKTLVDWLVKKYPELKLVGDDPKLRPGIVHRLDKETSGVMVVARTQKVFEVLKQLFKNREVAKTYLALVRGIPKKLSGVIDAPIGRSARVRTKRALGPHARGVRPALTHYRVLERFPGYALLEIKPKTGRMHQIRVHLASIGLPIVGDHLYGSECAELVGLKHQLLHASSLSFSFPEGRRWHFEASLPDDVQAVVRQLRLLRKRR